MAGSSPESTFIDEFYANLNLEEQRGRVEFMEYDRKTPRLGHHYMLWAGWPQRNQSISWCLNKQW